MDGKIDPQLLQQSDENESVSGYSNTTSILPGLRRSLSQGQVPFAFLPKPKERTSWVWKHGSIYQAIDKNGTVKDRWRCNLCMYLWL